MANGAESEAGGGVRAWGRSLFFVAGKGLMLDFEAVQSRAAPGFSALDPVWPIAGLDPVQTRFGPNFSSSTD